MRKTVLITGCSTGIGKQLALAMAVSGYRVYATARSLHNVEALAAKGILPLQLDVTREDSIGRAIAKIEADGNRVAVLVNNAGYGAMGPLAEMPAAELELQFQTNVFGPMSLIRHCMPHMQEQGDGLIVNIGSVSGIFVTPFSGAYCATKSAVHALSDALRMELAPFNIHVMTVQPGAIESDFGQNAEASLKRTFSAHSKYSSIKEHIEKRARASQNNPTPTSVFVSDLLNEMQKPHPAAVKKIGNGSRSLSLLGRWLPQPIRDNILSKTFGLTALRAKLNAATSTPGKPM
ncbi:MAG: SDR family oxidoreductase [Ketobacter sp.]|nr:MAG: SDR family oxidoreductase [Ketobacter sp.]